MASAGELRGASAPFVLTLEMDGEAFAAFDALRREHYAPERNLVPAHVTLFHRLPAERAREIRLLLTKLASAERPIDVEVGEAKVLQSGVAIFLDSPRLHALRERLAGEWWPWLEARDQAGFRPHVTIRTTESEAEARRTRESLGRGVLPRRLRGLGLHLWRYRDGPWESDRLFRFR
jgi:2'-5' RNA ligase